MSQNETQKTNEELLRDNPAQTTAPPQIKLEQEPIPNPDLNVDNGKNR